MKFKQGSFIPKVTGDFKYKPGTKNFKKLFLSKNPDEEKLEYIFYQYSSKLRKHFEGITFKNKSKYLKTVTIPVSLNPLTMFLIQDIYYTWTGEFIPLNKFFSVLIEWFIKTYDTQTLRINNKELPIKLVKNKRILKIKKFNRTFSKYYKNIMKEKFISNKNAKSVF